MLEISEEQNAILITNKGERLFPQVLNFWLREISKELGMSHKTIHSLRHTNITLQIMEGVPISIVASRAGHARASTTIDIYTHFVKSVDNQAAQALNNMFVAY